MGSFYDLRPQNPLDPEFLDRDPREAIRQIQANFEEVYSNVGDAVYDITVISAGAAGGQTITGGTAAGEDLTLNSTSHATKGSIFLGAQSEFDDANDRLGIGVLTPTDKLEVAGKTKTTTFQMTTTPASGNLLMSDASGNGSWTSLAAAGVAPNDASYLSLGLSSGLTSERVLTAGTGVSFADTGVNGTLTINTTGLAPNDASYLTLGLASGLSSERVLTAGTGVSFADTGVNGTLTVSIGQAVGTTSNVTFNNLEVDGALDHDGSTVGFFGTAPATIPAAYTQTYATASRTHSALTSSTLTDSTGWTANTTVAALAAVGIDVVNSASQPDVNTRLGTMNDNFAALVAQVNALRVDLENTKQVLNQVLDDQQTFGLLQ